jgi:rhomboid protease GluP
MYSVFTRRGDWKSFYKNSPVTSVLIIINTLMLVVVLLTGGFGNYNLVSLGGILPSLVKDGEYWRIITAAFLHGSVIHFASNIIIGLLTLSSALERMIGSKKFSFIYFGSMLISGIAVVLLSDLNVVTIGASGAIFGALGSLLYITLYRKDMVTHQDAQSIWGLIAINIVFTLIASGISISGHVGGIVSGFLLSYIIIRRNVFKVLH